MGTTTIRLPDDLKAQVERVAAARGASAHAFMLEAIAEGPASAPARPAATEALRKLRAKELPSVNLQEIRRERRPGSQYADPENCRYEIAQAEALMTREGIRWINSTAKSIEEIATTILRELRLERHVY